MHVGALAKKPRRWSVKMRKVVSNSSTRVLPVIDFGTHSLLSTVNLYNYACLRCSVL